MPAMCDTTYDSHRPSATSVSPENLGMTRKPILAKPAVTFNCMTNQSTPAVRTSTVIPAPPGLSIIYNSGGAKPIVALHITTTGPTIPEVTALYLDRDGSVKPITNDQDVQMAAWGGRGSVVHDNQGDFYN